MKLKYMFVGTILLISTFSFKLQAQSPSITQDRTHIIFKNDYVTYKISKSGGSDSLNINETGERLVNQLRPFASYKDEYGCHDDISEIVFLPDWFFTGRFFTGTLSVRFPENVLMRIQCEAYRTHFVFRLIEIVNSLTGDPIKDLERIQIARLHLSGNDFSNYIGAVYQDDFIVSELALTPSTQTISDPAPGAIEQYTIDANSYSIVQLMDLKVALLACPKTNWLNHVEEIEIQHDLPHPTIDGTWSKIHPDVNSSYLLVDITEDNDDSIINCAVKGKFKYIVPYVLTWAQTAGHYHINTTNYPPDRSDPPGLEGLTSLGAVVNKVKTNGLKFGFHTLSCLISRNDPYAADRINLAKHDGRVIEFHSRYVPDINARPFLLNEIAANFARIYNLVDADFAYLDGAAGIGNVLPEATWYPVALMEYTFYANLSEVSDNIFLQASAQKGDFQWHVLARGVSGDHAFIGVEPYMDHFKLGWYQPIYERAFVPEELGWIGLLAKYGRPNPIEDSFASTTIDEIEYQMNRALGHGLPISLETHYEELDSNAVTDSIFTLIGNYERLRLSNYFPDTLLQRLKQPDDTLISQYHLKKEQRHLVKNSRGVFGFQRQAYAEHVISEPGGESFEVINPFADQPLKVKITALPTAARFGYHRNIILASVDADSLDITKGKQEHITYEPPREVRGMINIRVTNSSSSKTGWLKLSRSLPTSSSDLSRHKAIALRVTGDAKGEVVSIQLANNGVVRRQYQFVIDFRGRQIKELFLPSTAELFKYPYKDVGHDSGIPFDVKNSFRGFNYREVAELSIYIKNIPPAETINLSLGPIKALWQEYPELENAAITIHGKTIGFSTALAPREMVKGYEPWEYLTFDGAKYAEFDGNNNIDSTTITTLDEIPILAHGANTVFYRHTGANKALLTFIMEDTPKFHGDYFIWFNPLNFQTITGSYLSIIKALSGHSIRVRTTAAGDLQWINLGLSLPSYIKIKQVVLHYTLSNSRSYISQVRLTETTEPGVALVKHDDGTDLRRTTATEYHSHLLRELQPNGSITLALRLNFASVEDVIEIGGTGVLVKEID